MHNFSKTHENNVQNAFHTEQVNSILSDIENVPFALRGAKIKTLLYWLFCVVAASELTAAIFFYVASVGAPFYISVVAAVIVGFCFHGLLHHVLTDTSKGLVFTKHRESKAMKAEVNTNVVLSILLLMIAACTVFFIGKKGFTNYRAMKYENTESVKPKIQQLEITADMLTNKRGKISSEKLEQLAAVTNSAASATLANSAASKSNRDSYNFDTENITDIVGASAFILELLLALLAYSIATAKFAATIEEQARKQQTSVSNGSDAKQRTTIIPGATLPPISNNDIRRSIGFIRYDDTTVNNGSDSASVINGSNNGSDNGSDKPPLKRGMVRPCDYCGVEYTVYKSDHYYHTTECKVKSWNDKAGVEFDLALKTKQRKAVKK